MGTLTLNINRTDSEVTVVIPSIDGNALIESFSIDPIKTDLEILTIVTDDLTTKGYDLT